MINPSYLLAAFVFLPLTVQAQAPQARPTFSPKIAASAAAVKKVKQKPSLARPTAAQRAPAPGSLSAVTMPNGEVRMSRKKVGAK